ncbi:amidohydrolase family protein [Candidatus Woesearchaeota archaeon]|nr:amidohydrolase family protein [Candidatus Woesearchaeota archaeon]
MILEEGNLVKRHILLEDHKIAYISEEVITADEAIDIKGKIVIPGLIDCHVHFREPGLTHKEDFLSGSIAAARGGITTFLDMPNTIPPTTTVRDLEEKRKLAQKSIVNYGFHFGSTPDNIDEIKNVKNIASVKIFMDTSTGNLRIDDIEKIEDIMKEARLCTVHAEGESLEKAIKTASRLKKKFYACHISSEDEIGMIRKNKKHAYCEVTPHHLFLTEADRDKLGRLAEVRPSLKKKEDQEALWKALQAGIVDTIATDHAPHKKEEKLNEGMSGLPGVETMLALLLDAVNGKRLTLQQVIELTSRNPARIFRIKNKGILKEGYDADLTVIDMELEKEVKPDILFSKAKWSPFEGKILKGWPIMTIVRGAVVYDHGNTYEVNAQEIRYEKLKPRGLFKKKETEKIHEEGGDGEGGEGSSMEGIPPEKNDADTMQGR